jgi:hypothetical protein
MQRHLFPSKTQPHHSKMKTLVCAILFSAALGLPSRANVTYEYKPTALPQDSVPAWAALGGGALQGEVLDGILTAKTDRTSWSQWRIGTAPGGTREFGDATALQIPPGGALTVDFRVKVQPNTGNHQAFQINLSNGGSGPSITFSPTQIAISGVTKPIDVDSTQWSDYRLVLEGTKFDFYCTKTQTTRSVELSPGDWGQFINFGFPALTGASEPVERSFQIKFLKWQPGVADRQFPVAAEK